jgi:hypothetical protein
MEKVLGFLFLLCSALAAAAQVTLPTGRVVPKDSFIVFLFVGHSNMTGRDRVALDTAESPFLWNCLLNRPPQLAWIPAREPLHIENPPDQEFGCGPGMPFLKALGIAYPGYYFGIIQNSNSGYCVQGNFRRGKDAYDEEIGAASLFAGTVTLGGIVAMIGWVEAEDGSVAANPFRFAFQESCMVAEMRSDLQKPDLPFVIGEFENGASSPLAVDRDTVAAQIFATPARITNSAIVSSEGMTYTDDHHYDCSSQKVWGERAARVLVDHGWGPGRTSTAEPLAWCAPSGTLSPHRGDEIRFFDPRGRLVASIPVASDGIIPHSELRGMYIVKHVRGPTALATTLRFLF